MPISLIKAICPSLLILAFVLAVLIGFREKRLFLAILFGWVLFVLAFLFQDVISGLLVYLFHGKKEATEIMPEQPGLAGALLVGWVLPLIGYFLGKGIRVLTKKLSVQRGQ